MPTPGHHSRQEILTQKFAWESALAGVHAQATSPQDIHRRNAGRDLLFVACGSPYYLGLSAAALAQQRSRRARAVPSSELLLFPESALLRLGRRPLSSPSRAPGRPARPSLPCAP